MLATAETGATAGGQMAVTSASGANQFHGSALEFVRNDIFDARSFIDDTKPPFRLNQFGGSLGGPIGRDKTFFFTSYEGYRQTLGQTLVGFVPTDAFRAQVAAQSPALIPILNAYPEGSLPVAGNPDVSEFVGDGRSTSPSIGQLRQFPTATPTTSARTSSWGFLSFLPAALRPRSGSTQRSLRCPPQAPPATRDGMWRPV
jgi:hypothetical protein